MNNVVFLKTSDEEWIKSLEELKKRKVTHAVIIYRGKEGDVEYCSHGYEDLTYLIGMIERTKNHMHNISTTF